MCTLVLSYCTCSYRTAQEVKDQRENNDAIAQLEQYAIEGNLITEEEMKVILPGRVCVLLGYLSCILYFSHKITDVYL